MGIIDVHAEIGSTPVWGVSFTEANLARSMQKYGVQRSVISSTIGNSCDFRRGNAQIAKRVESKKAMLGCVVVNMNYPEQAQQEMHAYLTSDLYAALLLTSGIRDRHVT